MKNVSENMWLTWEQGNYTGDDRPVTRATISKRTVRTSSGSDGDLENLLEGSDDEFRPQLFRTLLFGVGNFDEVEITGIKRIAIDKRLSADAATMTMQIVNAGVVDPLENLDESYSGDSSAPTKRELREYGSPGRLTYRRGLASSGGGEPNRWGHDLDPTWVDMFLPNRLIRTFQGYGTDGAAQPWDDTKLTATGIWLIDTVDMSVDGTLSVQCRDMAKLLIEQRLYPPIIPTENYPLEFCGPYKKTYTQTSEVVEETAASTGDNVAKHSTRTWDSSAAPYYGTNASVFGHRATDAFDGDESTYWISMRNSQPDADWSYEWLDAATGGEPVNQIRWRPWKSGYTVYVCVHADGKWQGDATVPYNRNAQPAYPNDSDTKYVMKLNVSSENWQTIDLPDTYNADRVRLTFTDLQWFGKISGGDYRAGVREFQVRAFTPATTTTTEVEEEIVENEEGNITDYTDIIKLLISWAGFYWPEGTGDALFDNDEWGSLGGRAWGDFFYSGAYPIEPPCIDPSYWDNKSVMDGINQIKEILGFLAYVDSTGGLIWRPPNIWRNGNYVTGLGFKPGEEWIRTIDENHVLLDYGVTVDDKNLRSEVVVVSSDDPSLYGSFRPAYAEGEEAPTSQESQAQAAGPGSGIVTDLSLLAGQERVMLVPDYPWGQDQDNPQRAQAEVEKFAYLVTLWIHWSYRRAKFRIPAMPALEPDDQVRIFERTTSETYIHYLTGVRSTHDLQTGEFYMDVDTHWLGNGPDSQWHMYVSDMSPALWSYLCSIGQLPDNLCNPDDPDAGGVNFPDDWYLWEPVEIPDPLPRDPDELAKLYPELPPVDDVSWDFDYESPYPVDTGTGDDSDGTGKKPDGSVLTCTNAWMDRYWTGAGPNSGNCCRSNLKRFRFYGANGTYSYTVTDDRVVQAYGLLSDLFIAEGINVKWASGCVCRKISGSNTWSNHAYGVAVDINSGWLPWGKSIYDYTTVGGQSYLKYLNVYARTSDIRALDTGGNPTIPIFKWGQNFRKPDPMHWQVCCDPRALARGVYDLKSGAPL